MPLQIRRFALVFWTLVCWSLPQAFAAPAWEGVSLPACLAQSRDGSISELPVNNSQLLDWKRNEKNQFQQRGHLQGLITFIDTRKDDHAKFFVQVGPSPKDVIEVIYNKSFGALPTLQIGMSVEACGDFIVSSAPAGGYPKSPAGALLHWVHVSSSPRHLSGYVAINGVVYGQKGSGDSRRRPPRRNRLLPEGFVMVDAFDLSLPGRARPATAVARARLDRVLRDPILSSTVRAIQNQYRAECVSAGAESIAWDCVSSERCSYTGSILCKGAETNGIIIDFKGYDDGETNVLHGVELTHEAQRLPADFQ